MTKSLSATLSGPCHRWPSALGQQNLRGSGVETMAVHPLIGTPC